MTQYTVRSVPVAAIPQTPLKGNSRWASVCDQALAQKNGEALCLTFDTLIRAIRAANAVRSRIVVHDLPLKCERRGQLVYVSKVPNSAPGTGAMEAA